MQKCFDQSNKTDVLKVSLDWNQPR